MAQAMRNRSVVIDSDTCRCTRASFRSKLGLAGRHKTDRDLTVSAAVAIAIRPSVMRLIDAVRFVHATDWERQLISVVHQNLTGPFAIHGAANGPSLFEPSLLDAFEIQLLPFLFPQLVVRNVCGRRGWAALRDLYKRGHDHCFTD